MAEPVEEVWNALHGGASPVVVVYFPDIGARPSAIAEVVSIAQPSWRVHETASLSDALDHPDDLVLLVPDDEPAVVEELDGLRDAFDGRSAPVVLFLLRGGRGQRAFVTSLGLVGWVRGSDVDLDPPSDFDEEAERAAFERVAGESVESWLARYRAGDVPGDSQSLAKTYRALLLERREEPDVG